MPHTHRTKDAIGWINRNKARVGAYALLAIVGAYAVTYTLASDTTSTTDRATTHALAYSLWTDPTAPSGRVVLVHGAPARATSWDTLIESMETRSAFPAREVIAVDRPGYGNSAMPEDVSLAGQARAMRPLLDHDEPVVLVGHSYGGPIALRAAIEYPHRIKAIVLLAGATDAYMDDSVFFRKTVEGLRAAVPDPWAVSNRELLALTDENRAMEPLLGRVTCHVIVVHGTWDPVCPHDSTVRYLRERLVNASLEVVSLQRTGHNVHSSHPDVVLNAITRAFDIGASGTVVEASVQLDLCAEEAGDQIAAARCETPSCDEPAVIASKR